MNKYCQGPKCHTYTTKDRIRGSKGDKHYQTRKRSQFFYGQGNFCTFNCLSDWWSQFGTRAVDHFGRVHEPKRQDASGAWYKDYKYNYNNNPTYPKLNSHYTHYFVNDLLGERRPITEQQYQDANFTTPS